MPIKNFDKHYWYHRNELICYSDGSYLVSSNIPIKSFLFSVFG